MFNGCGGCGDILWLLLLCCCGDGCGCKKVDCKDLIMLYTIMSCCGKDKCCC